MQNGGFGALNVFISMENLSLTYSVFFPLTSAFSFLQFMETCMPRQKLKIIPLLIKTQPWGFFSAQTTTPQTRSGAHIQQKGCEQHEIVTQGSNNQHSTQFCLSTSILKCLNWLGKHYTETKCRCTFTYCVKIWEESNSRAAVHREGHKGFDIQGRLHHQGRCTHKGGKCSSACQEQTKPAIHSIFFSALHTT